MTTNGGQRVDIEPIDEQPEPRVFGPPEPTPPTRRAPIIAIAALLVCAVVVGSIVVVRHRDTTARAHDRERVGSGPQLGDHWHIALGVNDCGRWVPNWRWPPGAAPSGGPARAGSDGTTYAGLHSHGDGIIHIEPLTDDEMGAHATLGRYFRYGGWQLDANAVTFVGVHERNGNRCRGKPGVLRWAVNGKEVHGDPSAYELRNGDVVELVFTTADAPLPRETAIPSYTELREIMGDGITTA